MIIVQKRKNEKIEGMLKRFKTKFRNIGVVQELRERQEYKKPSVKKREIKKKAIFLDKKSNGLK